MYAANRCETQILRDKKSGNMLKVCGISASIHITWRLKTQKKNLSVTFLEFWEEYATGEVSIRYH